VITKTENLREIALKPSFFVYGPSIDQGIPLPKRI